jgi:hypothetical protein
MQAREIARTEWSSFFESFTRQHEHWLVTVEEIPGGEGSTCVEARDQSLRGIFVDGHDDTISIALGDTREDHLTHTIAHPTRVILEQTDAGVDQGVRINRDHDQATRVRFRSAVRPEEVDGLPHATGPS